jgi:hypothetical protein
MTNNPYVTILFRGTAEEGMKTCIGSFNAPTDTLGQSAKLIYGRTVPDREYFLIRDEAPVFHVGTRFWVNKCVGHRDIMDQDDVGEGQVYLQQHPQNHHRNLCLGCHDHVGRIHVVGGGCAVGGISLCRMCFGVGGMMGGPRVGLPPVDGTCLGIINGDGAWNGRTLGTGDRLGPTLGYGARSGLTV